MSNARAPKKYKVAFHTEKNNNTQWSEIYSLMLPCISNKFKTWTCHTAHTIKYFREIFHGSI